MPGTVGANRIQLGHVTALLLSDNKFSLELMLTVLTGLGVGQKYPCTSVEGARKILDNLKVDVVIVDCDGTSIDGPDFTRNLRADRQSKCFAVPVIMVTPAINAMVLARVRDSGADGILAKPYAPAGMLKWLGVLLKDRERSSGSLNAETG